MNKNLKKQIFKKRVESDFKRGLSYIDNNKVVGYISAYITIQKTDFAIMINSKSSKVENIIFSQNDKF